VINTATPGLIGYALADRAAAVQLWEPAYTTLLSKKSDMRHHRHRHCGQLAEIHRQPQHSLSRRRRAHRLGREEPQAGRETLRHLQGGRRMGSRLTPTMRRS